MKLQIQNLAALDLCHATAEGWEDRVKSLLASGVDPNSRWDDWEPAPAETDGVRASQPRFAFEATYMPALCRAAWENCDLAKTMRLMTALLQHGADPYALFRQPIFNYKLLPVFPGDGGDPEYEADEHDLNGIKFALWDIIDQALRPEYERLGIWGERTGRFGLPEPYDHIDFEPRFPHEYGACSALHTLLEAGAFVEPILKYLGDGLDVEQRDPQGRTLFLAACRSTLGLDGAVDGVFLSLTQARALPNPYPQPGNPWQEFQRFTSTCTGPSLLDFFVDRGADLLAVDKYGQNALHHMLAFIDRDNSNVPPLINASLKYLIQRCPSLLNQPDAVGICPLHYAIRRMCDYHQDGGAPEAVFHFEAAVYDLLAANADPLVRDSRGSTVLHYLAAGKLGEGDRLGNEQRRLLSVFLERGVDPKARNEAGVTALELMFMTWDPEEDEHDYDNFYAIGQEVVSAFERAGYILTETNAAGQTILHLVAALDSDRAGPWFDLLKDKGLDLEAKDKKGGTPLDAAKRNKWIKL
ncbi:ankyrin repeat-containing domain protein [Aspergillus recurvatus]